MLAERVRQMSVEEYLAYEESSEESHEYIHGELYEMTGARLNHGKIIARLITALSIRLAKTDCDVIASTIRIKVRESDFLIPDVTVVCGEPETEADTRLLLNPILVFEVTSPSSINYDRGLKRKNYCDLPSVQAYLVVDQHRMLVELYTRSGTGWRIDAFSNLDDDVPLEALNCSLHMREIYRDIQFET